VLALEMYTYLDRSTRSIKRLNFRIQAILLLWLADAYSSTSTVESSWLSTNCPLSSILAPTGRSVASTSCDDMELMEGWKSGQQISRSTSRSAAWWCRDGLQNDSQRWVTMTLWNFHRHAVDCPAAAVAALVVSADEQTVSTTIWHIGWATQ